MKQGEIAREVLLHILVVEGIRNDSIIQAFQRVAQSAIRNKANFNSQDAGYFLQDMLREGKHAMLLSDADAFRVGSEILKHILSRSPDPHFAFLANAWRIPDLHPGEAREFAERVWPER